MKKKKAPLKMKTTILKEGPPYVLVRSYSAGVFVGELKERDRTNKCAVLNACRRIHYWDGAASLSQLAEDGVSKPQNCRFTMETNNHEIAEVIEVIPVSEKAREVIAAVKPWKM